MKRLYVALVALTLAFTVLIPTARADVPSPFTTKLFDFSGWRQLTQYSRPTTSQFRNAAATATPVGNIATQPTIAVDAVDSVTPTPAVNAVIYPLPADAKVVPLWDTRNTIMFNTSLSMDEVMSFYRTELTAEDAVERSMLTLSDPESQAWFSMVFDGWQGRTDKAVVIQGVLIAPNQYTVTIRLERV